jgi:hypothetical protein
MFSKRYQLLVFSKDSKRSRGRPRITSISTFFSKNKNWLKHICIYKLKYNTEWIWKLIEFVAVCGTDWNRQIISKSKEQSHQIVETIILLYSEVMKMRNNTLEMINIRCEIGNLQITHAKCKVIKSVEYEGDRDNWKYSVNDRIRLKRFG